MGHYTDALIREVDSYRDAAKGYDVDTVFFGGGTPGILPLDHMERIVDALHNTFSILPHAEVTGETNPAVTDAHVLEGWQRLGMTRLSMGIQSFQDEELRLLGRLHTAEEAIRFYHMARESGFDNINMDLMYAIPTQTDSSWEHTLSVAIGLQPEHVSAYALKVEEGTPFWRWKDTLHLPDEDTDFLRYETCVQMLEGAGYTHYEVSNYAKEGRESRHNLRYWRESPYIGLGLNAYSYFEGYRYGCDRDFSAYVQRDFSYHPKGDCIDAPQEEYEYVMLGLRLGSGISHEAFRERFGGDFLAIYGERLTPYQKGGYVEITPTHTRLTYRGMYVMNSILADIL